MTALSDAERRAALRARVTAWSDGTPVRAECPVCHLEYGVRYGHTFTRHGPSTRSCEGSGVLVDWEAGR